MRERRVVREARTETWPRPRGESKGQKYQDAPLKKEGRTGQNEGRDGQQPPSRGGGRGVLLANVSLLRK